MNDSPVPADPDATPAPDEPLLPGAGAAAEADSGPYRVLARKYRPTTFADLIGQEAMVRTLTNAFSSGRLAHAFILTGVRGIGKTTTARIVARALNCIGPDGQGEPTVSPCGVCANCKAIAEDRHVDVLEMDAASRTGVDDIRELIEGVRYRPTSARYKVYIIDEVHMLSKSAFNALLKTLEEPPEHVKFIFATTEIRKVPVTVLSRCQRFDLRRVEADVLAAHFGAIAEKECAAVEPDALKLIVRAADGSVRDGLSLLDQAIAHGAQQVTAEQVRDMLGLADRSVTFEVFDAVMRGDAPSALDRLSTQYAAGADPAVVLEDLLELTHWLTRVRVVPAVADDPGLPEAERGRGREMATSLTMGALTRAWQMLLKGLGEVRVAPSPLQAAEMVLVRLAYAAELPTPAQAVEMAQGTSSGGGTVVAPSPSSAAPTPPPAVPSPPPQGAPTAAPSTPAPSGGDPASPRSGPGPETALKTEPQPDPEAAPAAPDPATFQAVVDLVGEAREGILHAHLISNVHLVRFEPGRIELRPSEHATPNLANQLTKFLAEQTGRRWVVTVSAEAGEPTLQQQAEAKAAAAKADAARHPLVQAVMETFPGATIGRIHRTELPDAPPPEDDEAPDDDA